MALSDQEVNKQIQHMVSFIEQEAAEKANEILVKAEEEFNIEKGRIVQQEKLKVMSLYEKKEKQVETQRKIVYSNELNKNRLQVLQARANHVDQIIDEARKQLSKISADQGKYKGVLEAMVLEGVFALEDKDVLVECRAADRSLVEGVLGSAAAKAKEALGYDVKIGMSNQSLSDNSAGGVVVTTKDGRVRCDQTLEARLEFIAQKLTPEVRRILYGNSAGRKYFD